MKRTVLLLLLIIVLPVSLFSQILNAGFESWTSGNPDDWATNNSPPDLVPITQTNSSHSGSSAMQGTVIDYMGVTITPAFLSGTDGYGFPFSSRPGSFQGWYKMTSAGTGGDQLEIAVGFYKNETAVGAGFLLLQDAQSYTQFSTDITWLTSDIPDTVYITGLIVNGGGTPNVGSTFFLDDLTFSGATAVQPEENTTLQFELAQNYPNPFNPSTTISYTLPKASFVTLKVYNLLGQEVAELINENQYAGQHSVEFSSADVKGTDLPSGLYIYKLTAGSFTQTRKMMLLK